MQSLQFARLWTTVSTSIGKEVMLKFIDMLSEFGEPNKAPKFEGNNMVAIIDPKK